MKIYCSVLLFCSLLFISSCSSSYELKSIERTQILVDKRYDVTPDKKAEHFIAPYRAKIDSIMSPIVGYSEQYMTARRPEGLLSNLLPDILVWAANKDFGEQPDFAVYNIGGMRAAIAKGEVKRGDILDVAPFENKICFITLSGHDVKCLFEQIAHRKGEALSHAVKLEITKDGKLRKATINNESIDFNKKYRIATIDYVAAGNDDMTAFQQGTNLVSPQSEKNNVRYVIMDYFLDKMKKGQVVTSKLEERIKIVP